MGTVAMKCRSKTASMSGSVFHALLQRLRLCRSARSERLSTSTLRPTTLTLPVRHRALADRSNYDLMLYDFSENGKFQLPGFIWSSLNFSEENKKRPRRCKLRAPLALHVCRPHARP